VEFHAPIVAKRKEKPRKLILSRKRYDKTKNARVNRENYSRKLRPKWKPSSDLVTRRIMGSINMEVKLVSKKQRTV
jgi:hypothetical protein